MPPSIHLNTRPSHLFGPTDKITWLPSPRISRQTELRRTSITRHHAPRLQNCHKTKCVWRVSLESKGGHTEAVLTSYHTMAGKEICPPIRRSTLLADLPLFNPVTSSVARICYQKRPDLRNLRSKDFSHGYHTT